MTISAVQAGVIAAILVTGSAKTHSAPPCLRASVVCGTAENESRTPGRSSQEGRAAQREEYTDLFVSLASQALAQPRLAAPMPCVPHWLAANDHVVVAVSDAGSTAGLARGDTLQRIGSTALTGRANGVWDVAMRALDAEAADYAVDVTRAGDTVRLTLPCASARARRLHAAERAMWMAVTQRDWAGCIERGREMIRAFGASFSPPLMIMARCASAPSGVPDAMLTGELGNVLLHELVAHPGPSADLREQLLLTLRDLDTIRQAGGEDLASPLRARMVEYGVLTQ